MSNRVVISDNERVILQEFNGNYFTFVDRETDYVFQINVDKIDSIIEFLEQIKNNK